MVPDPPVAPRWGLSRYVILLAVLALHMAVLAVLLLKPRPGNISAPMSHSIELLYLAPATLPKIRSESAPPRRFSGDTAITMAPPVLDSPSTSLSPPTSGSDGSGSGVDWAAEARRALQAFEIRSHQPPANDSVSSSPEENNWWPRARHHAGDQFKTANGDWIVWINSSCYQVASAGGAAYGLGARLPLTVCPDESHTSRGDLFEQVPAYKKSRPNE